VFYFFGNGLGMFGPLRSTWWRRPPQDLHLVAVPTLVVPHLHIQCMIAIETHHSFSWSVMDHN